MPAREHPPPGTGARERPAHAGDRQDERPRRQGPSYLREHQTEFPGVDITPTQLRRYEDGALASHLLGYVGEIDPSRSSKRLGIGVRRGRPDRQVGDRGGLRQLPPWRAGVGQVRVNALNGVTSDPQPSKLPKAGYAVRLTIDADLQRAAEDALQYGIRARPVEAGNWAANGGAIVAMIPRNGEILALASDPTFDPIDVRRRCRAARTPDRAVRSGGERGAQLPDARTARSTASTRPAPSSSPSRRSPRSPTT